MQYYASAIIAKKWQLSERSVRNYCAQGRVPGAILEGKTWLIPEDAEKPTRAKRTTSRRRTLLKVLQEERIARLSGGIYHRVQIDLTYNSNHIEGSRLTHEQTRHIFETNTIGLAKESIPVDDIIETLNHFRCIDLIIDCAQGPLTETLIKKLHFMLKSGSSDANKTWFAVGNYKKLPNEVGGQETALPEEVPLKMKELLADYNAKTHPTLDDLLDFHVEFERIHPFQDGNGRVGRLILFKECLKHQIIPFVITDKLKYFYYRGLQKWPLECEYLRDTCLAAQDHFRALLDYFRIV
ncbi:MAG: Fic family protein [Kiritimatiellae bacterium]|nr:Fic family protein [Kiritimatiellia bacterium]